MSFVNLNYLVLTFYSEYGILFLERNRRVAPGTAGIWGVSNLENRQWRYRAQLIIVADKLFFIYQLFIYIILIEAISQAEESLKIVVSIIDGVKGSLGYARDDKLI